MGSEGESERGSGMGERLIFDLSEGVFSPGVADAEFVREDGECGKGWGVWERMGSEGERERGWGEDEALGRRKRGRTWKSLPQERMRSV